MSKISCDEPSQAQEPHAWETEASAALQHITERAVELARRASDDFYEKLEFSVRDYLKTDVQWNVQSSIDGAYRDRDEARAAFNTICKALGSYHEGWPCGPTLDLALKYALAEVATMKAALSAPTPAEG